MEFECMDWIPVAQPASSAWLFFGWNRIFDFLKYRTFIVISGMIVVCSVLVGI
jgi:hypothetical protein